MNSGSKRAFVLAAVVHVFAFGFIFFGYFVKPPEEKEETVVFQVFDPPSGAPSEIQPAAEAQPQPQPRPRLNIPEVELAPVELPPAERRERRPPPPPPPQPEPAPAPTPQPEPTPPPAPPRESMSIDEFRAQHGQPRQAPAPTPPPRTPVTAPRLDTSRIARDLQSTVTSASESRQVSQLSSSDQAALQAYFGRLHSAIERAWRKPEGMSTRLEATVQFSVSRDGRVFGARIVSSSGNNIFDRSILDAFGRVGSVGATPDGEGYTPQLTFRME
ncbi:MAG: TonB family protein [Opitutales bacterium]